MNYTRSNQFEYECPSCKTYHDSLDWAFPIYGENECVCDDCLRELQYTRIASHEETIKELESRLSNVEFRLACLELELTNHKKEFKDHLDELISL